MNQPIDGAARGKTDDDDHDLLTFGEVGERLRLEIAAATAEVERLIKREDSPDDKLVKAGARLDALQLAALRNSAQPINDDNFEKFFGYPGKARRNLPGPPTP